MMTQEEPRHGSVNRSEGPGAPEPVVDEAVVSDGSLLDRLLDEDGELKEPSVIQKELSNSWQKFKRKAGKFIQEATKEPLKQAGKQATAEAISKLSSLDNMLDGAEGKTPKEKENDGVSKPSRVDD